MQGNLGAFQKGVCFLTSFTLEGKSRKINAHDSLFILNFEYENYVLIY